MSDVIKNIPMNVTSKKNLGFGRPAENIVDANYEATVYVKPGTEELDEPEVYVFLDIETEEGNFAWAMTGSDLLGLDKNPVDEDDNRKVNDDGWVVTIPAKRSEEPTFELA